MSEIEKYICLRLGEVLYKFENCNDYFNKMWYAKGIINYYRQLGIDKEIIVDRFKITIS